LTASQVAAIIFAEVIERDPSFELERKDDEIIRLKMTMLVDIQDAMVQW
jgi:hypothetical protein